jgi:Ca2+-transporting ATPase
MSDRQGLTSEEAKKRLQETGENKLIRTSGVHPLRIILSQFTSPLIIILFVAAGISFGVGYLPGQESNILDAILILAIVLLSGAFGAIQDYKSEKTIEALQKMSSPHARVKRDGEVREIPSAEVVPGDLLLLESGDMVTADSLLVEASQLEIDESVLTGESKAIRKQKKEDVYSNTFVTSGNGVAIVQKTGMDTKLGVISSELQEIEEEQTSFQRELGQLSKTMSILTLIIGVIIAGIGILKFSLYTAILTAISLVVAAVPEGLPAVVVLALAIDAKMLVKKNALIRRLSIVESIGAVEVICTDKTGTLTKNEMTVTRLYFDGKVMDIADDESDFSPAGAAELLLQCGVLCNNARHGTDNQGQPKYFGEQTEIALLKVGEQYLSEDLYKGFERHSERSFSAERKMMSVVVSRDGEGLKVFSKGAPEVLVKKCSRILLDGEIKELNENHQSEILNQNKEFAGSALRVLGFAYKHTDSKEEETENDLVWIGLQAMLDPPGEGVVEAIRDCKSAGIRIIMITGDNPDTAKAIAEKVGLNSQGVVEGDEMQDMADETLREKLEGDINIYARTNPFHKLRILKILEESYNVAMTGDGVNDALALKKAGIGIAMGRKGTEVAKQASDMILLDDNFRTIRDAVKHGRKLFNNIRKFINYLLTCNFAEVAVIFIATLIFTLNEPVLYPIQLLWINLLTDGLVALALGIDPPTEDIMEKMPRKKNEPILNRQLKWLIALIGAEKTIILLLTFYIVMQLSGVEVARSALFAGFVVYEFVRIGSIRYMEKLSWFSNKWLILALVVSLILQLAIIYTPVNQYFYVEALGMKEWGILLIGSLIGFLLAIPITKAVLKYVPG